MHPGGPVVKNLPANAGDAGSGDPQIRKMLWRRWQPSPVFLLGKPHGEESGGLQLMGSRRVGHDWMTNAFSL